MTPRSPFPDQRPVRLQGAGIPCPAVLPSAPLHPARACKSLRPAGSRRAFGIRAPAWSLCMQEVRGQTRAFPAQTAQALCRLTEGKGDGNRTRRTTRNERAAAPLRAVKQTSTGTGSRLTGGRAPSCAWQTVSVIRKVQWPGMSLQCPGVSCPERRGLRGGGRRPGDCLPVVPGAAADRKASASRQRDAACGLSREKAGGMALRPYGPAQRKSGPDRQNDPGRRKRAQSKIVERYFLFSSLSCGKMGRYLYDRATTIQA